VSGKYVLGIDFGTESGRVLLADVADGREAAVHVTPYRHGVIQEALPDTDIALGDGFALQHPADYLEVLEKSVPAVLRESGVRPEAVVGIGVDFTTCTMLPVDEDLTPLCFHPGLRDNPHSWVKLWKHHAAQDETERINRLAAETNQPFLKRYGGKLSVEWMLPKMWETLRKAPDVYASADRFVEAGDWVVARLTGQFVRSVCMAGFKAVWHGEQGFPDDFFAMLDPGLARLAETKLRGRVVPLGARAGALAPRMAERLGLPAGIPVAAAVGDAHAAAVGTGITTPGRMVLVMGTSTCHMLLSDQEKAVEGISGVVRDGIVPGYYGYEAGQAAVGDLFAWFVERSVPPHVEREAKARGMTVHGWLERKAAAYRPGETGLLALDWWNGNRSVLADADLTGLIVGLHLQTKPEEIYRALLEATAFGTRTIIEAFEETGIAIDELYACGGLPQKNRLLMQIYADAAKREIKVADSTQTAALGAAIYAAVAAGSESGGYDRLEEAVRRMTRVKPETFKPDPERAAAYDGLYRMYRELHDHFGRAPGSIMKRLAAMRSGSAGH
jgi:L-ribulokinase